MPVEIWKNVYVGDAHNLTEAFGIIAEEFAHGTVDLVRGSYSFETDAFRFEVVATPKAL
jgi:hypothetical protein